MTEFFTRFENAVNMDYLKGALQVMWQGMAGIFVVMAAISIIVFIFTKFIKKK
ncbi:MAG: hypothetical protein Q4B40_04865 [Clostridia bacterium]|nr:hypothetical protein [Clostridia bacterium]